MLCTGVTLGDGFGHEIVETLSPLKWYISSSTLLVSTGGHEPGVESDLLSASFVVKAILKVIWNKGSLVSERFLLDG